MSDNKLVKSILDAATITGLVAGIGFLGRKSHQRRPDQRSQRKSYELHQVHSRHGGQHCPEEVSRGPEDNPNQYVNASIYNGDCRYYGWRGRS